VNNEINEIEKRLSKIEYDQINYSYEFLMKEYEKTFESIKDNFTSIERVTNFYKYLTAGLLSIIAFILGMVEKMNPLPALLINSMKLILFIFLPILGITIGVSSILSLTKYRKRDAWCYGRMNLIRKIMLSNDLSILPKFKEYSQSKYGEVSDFKFSGQNYLKHEWRYNALIIEVISTIWAVLIVNYFYEGKLLPFIPFILIPIVIIIGNSIYKKIFKDIVNHG
jgi:hypothetical protein